jgi:Leucine-rich repeat (LRR) protein
MMKNFIPGFDKVRNLLLIFLLALTFLKPASAISVKDSLALVALYDATNGPEWKNKSGWLSGTVNTWFGISLNGNNVTQINLSGNNLRGFIPSDIGKLTSLTHLDLNSNKLINSIPPEIENLTNLNYLRLYNNQLSGNIPPQIGGLIHLFDLLLFQNQLNGDIPPQIGNLKQLHLLWLNSNQLSGPIPVEIDSLRNLVSLNLWSNQLSGTIPHQIGNLSNLGSLYLDKNLLTGSIPVEIGQLSNLVTLKLEENQLSDTIPSQIGDLSLLTEINLEYNQLNGTIPVGFEKLKNLRFLKLSHNQLVGSIPSWIGNLSSLTEISLEYNQLEGTIPVDIEKLKDLQILKLGHNQLVGTIPSEIGYLSSLTDIYLEYNKLEGEIPREIGNFNYLYRLNLQHNYFDEIPNLKNVTSQLYCDSNLLTFEDIERNLYFIGKEKYYTFQYSPQYKFGSEDTITVIEGNSYKLSIPCGGEYNHYLWYKNEEAISNSVDSSFFNFDSIKLSDSGTYHIIVWNDSIPKLTLTSMPVHLNVIDYCIKHDSLALVALYNATGGDKWTHREGWLKEPIKNWWGITLSEDGCNVNQISMVIDGARKIGNNLIGTIPVEIGNLSQLEGLNLSFNHLTGTIPKEIGNLSELINLSLDYNNLTGNLPLELFNLSKLEVLHLPANQLLGEIPKEIGNLQHLKILELWNNQFSGLIPPQIGDLTDLGNLSIYSNQFTGSIPPEIGNLTRLIWLDMGNNFLTGEIPQSFKALKRLRGLHLYNNKLSGTIPEEIGELTFLNEIGLDRNQFTGTISNSIFNLPDLNSLLFYSNRITGSIPERDSNLSHVEFLKFEDNLIEDIPWFYNYDSVIYCANNHLTFEDFERNLAVIDKKEKGEIDFQYSPQLKFGREYDTLAFEDNPFRLSIPCGGKYNHYKWVKDNDTNYMAPDTSVLFFKSIGLENAGTYYLNVWNDSVPDLLLTSEPVHLHVKEHCIKNDSTVLAALYYATGGDKWLNKDGWVTKGRPVSTWYGITADSCSVLKIELSNNNLTGSIAIPIEIIPEGFEYLDQLNYLSLAHNNLTGEIPAAIGDFSELTNLNLSANSFTGIIPDKLYSLMNLRWLGLGENKLSGKISGEIGNLVNLRGINIESNMLSGSIPHEIGKLYNLTFLGLWDNQLTDSIPFEIGNLINLTDLNLHTNQLSGSIPHEIGKLVNLINLDLDVNRLTGKIPSEIGNLKKLERLMMWVNQLEGSIPDEIGQLTELMVLHLNDNLLNGTIPAGIGSLDQLYDLQLQNNYFDEMYNLSNVDTLLFCSTNNLTFEDFERNLEVIAKKDLGEVNFQYSPQRLFGRAYDTTAYEGAPFILSIYTGGIYNHYKWYKKEVQLSPAPDAYQFNFSAIQKADTGSYFITVTNDSVPGLTLQSLPVRIKLYYKPTLPDSKCDLINQPLSLTLSWNGAAWATSYALQVSTSSDFSSLVINQSGITTTSYLVSNLEYGTTYYWRVNASDSNGTSGWSEVCNFTTIPEKPDVPDLESPCGGDEIQNLSLTLSWFGSERAESYSLQVSTSPDFAVLFLNESGITSTSYQVSGLDFKTTYYWRVNASNITGASGWSETCNFTTYLPELHLINLIIIDGQHSPVFMIEGIQYFPENKLVVFTKWGKKIFSKKSYHNELDFSSYPAGTYYYVLDVNMKGEQKQFKNFVDVVKQ